MFLFILVHNGNFVGHKMIIAQWNSYSECGTRPILIILGGDSAMVQQYERVGEVETDTCA